MFSLPMSIARAQSEWIELLANLEKVQNCIARVSGMPDDCNTKVVDGAALHKNFNRFLSSTNIDLNARAKNLSMCEMYLF